MLAAVHCRYKAIMAAGTIGRGLYSILKLKLSAQYLNLHRFYLYPAIIHLILLIFSVNGTNFFIQNVRLMRLFTLKFFLFFAAVSAALTTGAQIGSSKWSFSNPKPFGFSTFSISYADDNNALAVGNSGGIAKTTDGGGTWQYTTYVTKQDGEIVKPTLNEVQFVNGSIAYAVGTNGIAIKSVDGGINWTALTTPFSAARQEIYTVFFKDANTGYIGGTGDPVTRKTTLYKTTNGGSSWTAEHEFPAPTFDYYDPGLFKVKFSQSGVGYVTGATGSVWKFNGTTWQDYSITTSTVFPNLAAHDTTLYDNFMGGFDTVYSTPVENAYGLEQQNYRGLVILDDTVILVSTQNNGGLIRINTNTAEGSYLLLNNGSAANSKYYPIGNSQMYNIASRDGQHVYVTGSDGTLIASADKGYTWRNFPVYPAGTVEANFGFYGVDVTAGGRIGLSGVNGVIADSLSAWRRPYKNAKGSSGFFGGYSIESIGFADDKNGIGVGGGGAILRTQDGGDTWEDISNGSFQPWDRYTQVQYRSPTILYAAASNGQFYKSEDKGSSFDLLFAEPSNGSLNGMDFINNETGWLTASITYTDTATYESSFHSIIYRTTDGGLTWDSATTIFPTTTDYSDILSFNNIKFLNKDIGYVVGSNGSVYKSTDGGKTWVKQTVPADVAGINLLSIAVVDAIVAFISGEQGVVLKTVNGGATWTFTNNGLPGGYNRYGKILMNDALKGLVFTRGDVYSTTDGGANWTPYYAPVNIDLYAATFVAGTPGCTDLNCKKVFASGGLLGSPSILKFDADIVLPAKLSNLTGAATAAGNQLFWTVFSQETVSYYEVEKSADGRNFNVAGNKIYAGRSLSESYKWLDNDKVSGKYYYRVKVVETAGAVYYTNIIVLEAKYSAAWVAQVSHGNLLLNNPKLEKGVVNARVINASGQNIATKSWNQNGGAFNGAIPLPPAARGFYFVNIENGGTVTNFKILVH